LFIGGLYSILGGYHTVSQMKTFYDMTPAEQNQLDIFLGKINSATTVAAKLGRILRFKAILNFWEQRNDLNLAGYDTPDDIELQLSEIDQGF